MCVCWWSRVGNQPLAGYHFLVQARHPDGGNTQCMNDQWFLVQALEMAGTRYWAQMFIPFVRTQEFQWSMMNNHQLSLASLTIHTVLSMNFQEFPPAAAYCPISSINYHYQHLTAIFWLRINRWHVIQRPTIVSLTVDWSWYYVFVPIAHESLPII